MIIGAKENAMDAVSTNPLRIITNICDSGILEPRTCWMTKNDGKQIAIVLKNKNVTFRPATSDCRKL